MSGYVRHNNLQSIKRGLWSFISTGLRSLLWVNFKRSLLIQVSVILPAKGLQFTQLVFNLAFTIVKVKQVA